MARLPAGVRKRDDGKLEKRITIEGKRYSIYGSTSKELQEKELELREQIKNGLIKNNSITLDKYVELWKERKRAHNKANTIRIYYKMYDKHISPYIGNKRVQKIERNECITMFDELSKDKSIETSNYCLMVLNIILNDAVKDEIIIKNPAKGIKAHKRKKEKAIKTIHRALTVEEQKIFMEASKDSYYHELFSFLLLTGVRLGEAGALKWSDIDYKNNMIHINKTISKSEDEQLIIDTPKSESSIRDIPLNDDIKEILKEQKRKQALYFGNISSIDNNVFLTLRNKYIRQNVVNKSIYEIILSLESDGIYIKRFTAHAFRDTFATRYIENGGSPQVLKEILGHNTLAMTMDLYSQVLPNIKLEEMSRIKISV